MKTKKHNWQLSPFFADTEELVDFLNERGIKDFEIINGHYLQVIYKINYSRDK
jgi:hypothetical protein